MSLAVRPPETIPKQSSFAAGGRGSFARAPVASEAVAKIISARTVMELHFDPNSSEGPAPREIRSHYVGQVSESTPASKRFRTLEVPDMNRP